MSLLRKAPADKTAFTLRITADGTPRRITVIDRGRGPDSSYHIHLSRDGTVPPWLPPTSTYAVRDAAELDSVLATFAEYPELYSRPRGDALDEPDAIRYDEQAYDDPDGPEPPWGWGPPGE